MVARRGIGKGSDDLSDIYHGKGEARLLVRHHTAGDAANYQRCMMTPQCGAFAPFGAARNEAPPDAVLKLWGLAGPLLAAVHEY